MPNPHVELQRAGAALRSGQPKLAIGICEKLLTVRPRHIEARHLRGRCWAALGSWENAVIDFRRVLTDQGDFFPAWVDLGIAEALRGNFTDARPVLERALAMDSRPAEVHFGLGLCALQFGDHPQAVSALRGAIERNPRFPDAYNNLGVAYDRMGELPQAAECFQLAIAVHPDHVDALCNLGDVLVRLGNVPGSRDAFRRAAQIRPGEVTANLGLAHLASLTGDGAALLHHAKAACAAGAVLEPALASAVAIELETTGSVGPALEVLQAAARAHPQHPNVHDALGELLHRRGRLRESLDCYERALALDEQRLQTWINSGDALESLGALGRAIEHFEQALRLDPANARCIASIASCAYRRCDWDLTERMLTTLRMSAQGIDALPAFLLFASDLDPQEIAQSQQRRARATRWPAPPEVPPLPEAGAQDRLRIAYVSPDFRTHAVAYALAGVIERHDRRRISPIAIALNATDASPVGVRLRAAFDGWHEVADRTDRDVVRLIRELDVDIAIDLAGLTSGARPAIFAMRAAPLQVNYLGYPGSSGMDFIDFIVADSIVAPPADDGLYAERVARMPGSYLPFDDQRLIGEAVPSREAAGLPPRGFVFCAFTSPFKITRAVFSVWMELLRDVEGSVLWLRGMGAEAAGQLKNAAHELGVDPGRLLFAVSLESMEAHLSRLRLADVYLDTLPYNAHTTAAEALWAGVPLITCRGHYFAGRVGASVLAASGMDDLICGDLAAYRDLALGLARSPERLQELRQRLRSRAATVPLFDTTKYTRDFEDLLFRMHALRRT